MSMNDAIGQFFSEMARRGVDHLASLTGAARVCAHCRNDNLEEFSLTLPCCGRVLCGPCTARSLAYRWQTRFVVVCDDCQTAHTFAFSR